MNVKLIIKRKNSFVMKKMLLHNYYMKKKIYIYIQHTYVSFFLKLKKCLFDERMKYRR